MRRRCRSPGQAKRQRSVQPRPGPQDPAEDNGVPSGTRDEGTKERSAKSGLAWVLRSRTKKTAACAGMEFPPEAAQRANAGDVCRMTKTANAGPTLQSIANTCGMVNRRRTRRHSRSVNTESMSCILPPGWRVGGSSRGHGRSRRTRADQQQRPGRISRRGCCGILPTIPGLGAKRGNLSAAVGKNPQLRRGQACLLSVRTRSSATAATMIAPMMISWM